jgi:hypothetical protein
MLQTTRLLTAVIGLGISGTSAFAADPALLNLVMPDAKVLAGVNVASTRNSPLGQFVISKLGAIAQDPSFGELGFNPIQNVSELLVASPANTGTPTGLIMATGSFPVDKLTAAAAGQKNTQVQSYGGATLLVNFNPDSTNNAPHAVAFIGNTIAIAGDLASVKAAIDRNSGPAVSIDPTLSAKMNQLSSSEDQWLVSIAPVASLIPANATQQATATQGPVAQVLPLLKSVQSFDGGVKFGNTIAITGEAIANNPKNAQALQAVVNLGLALASSLNTSKDPHLAELVQLLQTIQSSVDGSTVNLALAIPESQVETLVNSLPRTGVVSVPAARRQ